MPVVFLMAGFGAFGKMPALGDFFRLGAGGDFVAAWDAWLQSALLGAERALGQGFEPAYMSAPIWRFALAPGVAGPQGALGVLMPSVDRVGRRFPLTLMVQTGVEEQVPLRNLLWQAPVLEAAETLALEALDDAMTRDLLAGRLGALALRPNPVPASIRTAGRALVLAADVPDLLCADLALDLAGGQLHRACAFAATIDGAARLILTSGLPQGEVATTLFAIGETGA